MGASSSDSSEWNNDDKWSSQVRKCGEMSRTCTGRSVSNKLVIDIDMDFGTVAESDLSLKSRSFLIRANDRLRKMLNRSSMQDFDKRSMIWEMFMSSTVEASVFMGKNYSNNLHSIKITGQNLTLKQMVEISEQFWSVSNQLGRFSMETVISDQWWRSHQSRMQRFVFSDSVSCLGKMNQNPTSNTVWERQLGCFKDSSQHRTLDTIDGEPMEFEWNIFQDSPHWSLSVKSKSSWAKWANPNNSKDELSSCRCSMTSYGDIKTMKRNVLLNPHLCLYSQ